MDIFKRIWKSEGFLISVLVAFLFFFGLFCWSSEINNGQKKEMRDAEIKIQDLSEGQKDLIKENLALRDEKRFAFQPVSVVKTETQETPQKEESQEEITATVEKIETNGIEEDWAGLKAQLDALELGIEAAEAQIAASQAPPSGVSAAAAN